MAQEVTTRATKSTTGCACACQDVPDSPGEQQGTSSIAFHRAALEKPCPHRCPSAEPHWDSIRHRVPQHGLLRGLEVVPSCPPTPGLPEDAALPCPAPSARGTHTCRGPAPLAGAAPGLCWCCSSTHSHPRRPLQQEQPSTTSQELSSEKINTETRVCSPGGREKQNSKINENSR